MKNPHRNGKEFKMIHYTVAKFWVLTAVLLNIQAFSDVTLCGRVKSVWHFEGA